MTEHQEEVLFIVLFLLAPLVVVALIGYAGLAAFRGVRQGVHDWRRDLQGGAPGVMGDQDAFLEAAQREVDEIAP